jgi:hypothetical protein
MSRQHYCSGMAALHPIHPPFAMAWPRSVEFIHHTQSTRWKRAGRRNGEKDIAVMPVTAVQYRTLQARQRSKSLDHWRDRVLRRDTTVLYCTVLCWRDNFWNTPLFFDYAPAIGWGLCTSCVPPRKVHQLPSPPVVPASLRWQSSALSESNKILSLTQHRYSTCLDRLPPVVYFS